MSLPETSREAEAVLADLRAAREADADWRAGRTWSLVYHADEATERLRNEAVELFAAENALSPDAFPALRDCETDVVGMTAALLGGGDGVVGNMTSGGTESILLAVYAAREHARVERSIDAPEVVVPETAHPAFSKAAHYFGVEIVRTPTREDHRADVDAMAAAISDRTALVVGSAPSYPHGVVDPIEEIAAIADDAGALCHVDACIGGFVLAFLPDLGYEVPAFDFSVDGVTSVSVDQHKYGYAPKGASSLLWRGPDLRTHQYFGFADWSGGVYAAPNLQGTRPGGPIAGTWAVMQYLGAEGYRSLVDGVMDTATELRERIDAIDGLAVVSDPDMCIFSVASTDEAVSIGAVHDRLADAGWVTGRLQRPSSIHLSVMPTHAAVVESFLEDLEAAVEAARSSPTGRETAATYGGGSGVDPHEDAVEAALRRLDTTFR